MSSLAPANYSAPASTHDLAGALVDRILFTQRSHRLRTGEKLSYDAALAKMANLDDEPEPAEILSPEIAAKVRAYLESQHYAPRSIARVLKVVARRGTVEFGLKRLLTAGDRAAIENLLPYASSYNDPAYDDFAGSRGRAGLAVRAKAKDGVWTN